jgi:hypothetical protein
MPPKCPRFAADLLEILANRYILLDVHSLFLAA